MWIYAITVPISYRKHYFANIKDASDARVKINEMLRYLGFHERIDMEDSIERIELLETSDPFKSYSVKD
jgi:hypothetical protein